MIEDRDILDFVTFCIGALAMSLRLPRKVVYGKLKNSGILNNYIIPSYDVLHTFSRPYMIEDITSYMREKGVLS